jgi:carbon-monoxide dehydrogenase medium subunit
MMKPAPFEYHDPGSLAGAIALLERYGGEARPLAGGQSLVPLMNFRLANPAAIIDLNRIGELSYIREDAGGVRIGAMTRQRAIEFSPLIGRLVPLLAEATRMVGHTPTRSRGTIGGSLAHADPAAEYPCVALALDAEMVLRSAAGERVVAAADFFQGLMSAAIGPREMLAEVRFPMTRDAGYAFEEFSLWHGDFALAGVAAIAAPDRSRGMTVRLAACSVGETPVRLRAAEEMRARGMGADNAGAAPDANHDQRRGGAFMPDARGAGGGRGDNHRRRFGAGWRTRPDSARLPRKSRIAMRLLHARDADGGARSAADQPLSHRTGNSRGPVGRALPMHRLSGNRRCRDGGGADARGGELMIAAKGAGARTAAL